jgi:tryptophan-rich sensory protein
MSAGRGVRALFQSLQQPRWALPLWIWYVFGGLYYVGCFLALRLLLESGLSSGAKKLCLGGLVLLMTVNAAWNLVFFRLRNLRLSFLLTIPYGLLAVAVLSCLWHDRGAAFDFFLIYCLYQAYAVAWTHCIWRMNAITARVKL